MSGLHEELTGDSAPACKLCVFVAALDAFSRSEWQRELALPVTVIANVAVVNALKRRGTELTEASVRRHRANHA